MNLSTIIGIEIALLGLVAFGAAPRVRRRWPTVAGLTLIVPSLLLISGIGLALFGAFGGATPLSSTPNPIAATVTSVDTGNRLYQANCAACHGVDGEGGGPLANTTPIQPPSLKAHLSQHTDGDLFYWISNGLPGGMPAWSSQLSETDRWNLINYLRAINEPGASIPPASVGPGSSGASGASPAGASTEPSAGPSPSAAAFLALPLTWAGVLAGMLAVRWRRRSRRGAS
jgi:mono/diheme cytochrome c family protein